MRTGLDRCRLAAPLRLRRFVVLLFVLASGVAPLGQQAGSGGRNSPEQRDKPYVILVSLDGFKAEYLDRFRLPNLRRVMQRGTRARAMIPVFPALTFPNHYSLVTGLHPGRHGIVSNRFFDPERKDTYAYTDIKKVTDGTWYRGEPIWVTAEKQGMVSACFFWPGSEAAIQNIRPSIWNRYDGKVSNAARVKTVLDWLRLPAERRPHVITLYFSELDTVSHDNPLESPLIETAAQSLDRSVGQLLDGIEGLPIRDRIHLLLTSDHGMVNTSPEQTIRLESLLEAGQLAELEASYGGPVASLHVREAATRATQIRDRINATLARGTAYLRSELEERFQYRDDPRGGDIVIVMDDGWSLSTPRPRETATNSPAKPPAPQPVRPPRWGMHGSDNGFPSMRALFLIMGPGIQQGAIVPEVQNVDVYPLMAELLEITPAADIDGRPGVIKTLISR